MPESQQLVLIKEALSAFALNEAESSIYLAVLGGGLRPASKIAKESGLNRSYAYDVLDSLVKKGLVRQQEKNSVRHYSSRELPELLELIEKKRNLLLVQRERLESFIPNLEELRKQASRPATMETFSGSAGLEAVYSGILVGKDELLRVFLARPSAVGEKGSVRAAKTRAAVRDKLERKRVLDGVSERVLSGFSACNDQATTEDDSNQLERLAVTTTSGSASDVYLFGGRVSLISKTELSAAVISLPLLYGFLVSLHDRLWVEHEQQLSAA